MFFTDATNNNVINESDIIQESHYYAFGMSYESYPFGVTSTPNKYQYNGKELNDDFGLNMMDYGARWYDAMIGRWTSADPLAEKYRRWSPYNYGINNPIRFIDPDGMQIDEGFSDMPAVGDPEIIRFVLAGSGRVANIYVYNDLVSYRADIDTDADGEGNHQGGQDRTSLKSRSIFNYNDVDPEKVAYIVIPGGENYKKLKENGVDLGDVAFPYHYKNEQSVFSIIADIGPSKKLREHSLLGADALGVKDGKNGNGDNSNNVFTFIFPGSRKYFIDPKSSFYTNGQAPTQAQINALGEYLYNLNLINIGNTTPALLKESSTNNYDNKKKK